jgi:hypothetical protein
VQLRALRDFIARKHATCHANFSLPNSIQQWEVHAKKFMLAISAKIVINGIYGRSAFG